MAMRHGACETSWSRTLRAVRGAGTVGALSLAIAAVGPMRAQDLDQPVALLEPNVRTGVLPNGFTYYVLPLAWTTPAQGSTPQRRVLLRLVVSAGSLDEDDDQPGVAHLVEHMAFRGSARFPEGDMVRYFESLGMRLGPHVNATTTYDHTSYTFDLPLSNESLPRVLEAIHDIAAGLTLGDASIERERAVITEEWRMRQGALSRTSGPLTAALLGPPYAARPAIGDPARLAAVPAERVRDFYHTHYGANRMALIVVGQVQPDVLVTRIRESFADLRQTPAMPVRSPVASHAETQFLPLADAQMPVATVSLLHPRPLPPVRNAGDVRHRLARTLAVRMIDARLTELPRQPRAPMVTASVSEDVLPAGLTAITLTAAVSDGRAADAVKALAGEIARLRREGFSIDEFEAARAALITSYERARVTPLALSEETLRHYLRGEPAFGPAGTLAHAKTLLPSLRADDITAVARDLLSDTGRLVTTLGLSPVTEGDLRQALEEGLQGHAPTPGIAAADPAAMPAAGTPRPGSVRARREVPGVGVTVLTLSNGVEVWLKSTGFRREVHVTAYAHGGSSLAPADAFIDASMSAMLIAGAGAGGLTPAERSAQLAGRPLRVLPLMSYFTHGISGAAMPDELETMLQLVHQYFTAPNLDPRALEPATRLMDAVLAAAAAVPAMAFEEQVMRVNAMDHHTAHVPRPSGVRIDPTRAAAYYRERFANAADFTFFFAGAFDEESLVPLVETYLGSLPSTGLRGTGVGTDLPRFPPEPVRTVVREGQEPRSQTAVTFLAGTGHGPPEKEHIHIAAAVLQSRLFARLRQELGATYTVAVAYADGGGPAAEGMVLIRYGSAPETAEQLAGIVLDEVTRLRETGPGPEELRAIVTGRLDAARRAPQNNIAWVEALQAAHLYGYDPQWFLDRPAYLERLTADEVRDTVARSRLTATPSSRCCRKSPPAADDTLVAGSW